MAIYIFGAGGFGREVLCLVRDMDRFFQEDSHPSFVVDDAYFSQPSIMGVPCIRRSEWREDGRVVVAVGDPAKRQEVVESLGGAEFATLVHPSAIVMGDHAGSGAIICAGAIATCDVTLGRHAHLNLHATIGHDCRAGDYLTASPGAKVSGNCTIGDRVYLGSNAAIREGVTICDDVTIGMCAAVVRDITDPGTYVGVPARRVG